MKFRISILFCLILISNANALTRIGAPTNELKFKEFGFGIDYTHNSEELTYDYYGDKEDLESEIDLIMLDFGFGMDNNSDVHFKFGVNQEEYSDMGFAWSIASKNTLHQINSLKFGLVAQVTGTYRSKYTYSEELYEFQLGIGPCYDMNDISLYAYPIFHLIDGDNNYNMSIEESSDFGVCAGFTLKPDKNININFEGQIIGDSYALGAGLIFKFGPEKPKVKKHSAVQKAKETGRPVRGYKATIDDNGKPVITPVFEDE